MFDHVGFPVSDVARSRAFYVAALAPLGFAMPGLADEPDTALADTSPSLRL